MRRTRPEVCDQRAKKRKLMSQFRCFPYGAARPFNHVLCE